MFSNGLDNIDTLTNVSGIAQANYTASDVLSFVEDSIEINYGTLYDTLSLPLRSSLVSYYTLSPPGDNSIAAGDSIAYTVTARDQFGNGIINYGGLNLIRQGSSTAGFSPGPYNFNGDSTLQFRVSDNSIGSFTVRVENTGNSAVSGTTGLITIQTASPDHLSILEGSGSIEVGTQRTLIVALEDVYGNRIAGQELTFSSLNGDGIFLDNGLTSDTSLTDANGAASEGYRASRSTSLGQDSIRVSYLALADTILMPLTTGLTSYYSFSPSGDNIISANDSIEYTVTARDQYGNPVPSVSFVNIIPSGSSTAIINPIPPLFFGTDTSVVFTVRDTVVGSFSVRAEKQFENEISGQSGLITITPDSTTINIVEVSGDASGIPAGNDQLLRVRVSDSFANVVPGDSIRFIVRSGGGNFSGSDSVGVITDGAGNAEASLTTGLVAGTNLVTALRIDDRADSVQFTVETVSGGVSYYTLTPSGARISSPVIVLLIP